MCRNTFQFFKKVRPEIMAFGVILVNVVFAMFYLLIDPIRNPQNTLVFLLLFSLHFSISIISIKFFPFFDKKKIILLFILSRFAIFPMHPWLSDDVYTYIWQGKITANFENVYSDMPNSERWASYHGELYNKMSNIGVPAIYPPLTIFIYGLNSKLAISDNLYYQLYQWKLILLIFEALSFWLVLKFYPRRLKSLFVYTLLPLPLIEIVGQGHNEGLLLPLIVIFPLAFKELVNFKSKLNTGIILAIMTLIKIYPIFLAISILKSKIKIKNKFQIILISALIITLFILPFIINSKSVEVFLYGQNYYNLIASFNSAILEIYLYIFKIFNISNWWIIAPKAVQLTKLFTLAFILMKIKPSNLKEIINSMILILLAVLMISTKIHTWYFVPIILLSILNGNLILAIVLNLFMISYYPYLFSQFKANPIIDILLTIVIALGYFILTKSKIKFLDKC